MCGSGFYSITASLISDLRFSSFSVAEEGGRYGYDLFNIIGQPVQGQSYYGVVELEGNYQNNSLSCELVTDNGNLLQTVNLSPLYNNLLSGLIVIPNQPFLVRLSGMDSNGLNFVRYQRAAFHPQSISLSTQSELLSINSSTTVQVAIHNGYIFFFFWLL